MNKPAEGFCKTCDCCTDGIPTKIHIAVENAVKGVMTLGISLAVNAMRPKCPKCDHRMVYHRGNTAYWKKNLILK